MSDQIAAARAGDVLLRTMGGRCMMLRMPAPAVPADVTEQLGLATPLFQDLPLTPVVYRKARASIAAEKLVGSLGSSSASVLFAGALGVLSDDTLLEIESVTQQQVFAQAYVYRLVVRAPLAQST